MRAHRLSGTAFRSSLLLAAAVLVGGPAFGGTAYTYDALGRLISVRYDDGRQITYTYDAAGNRTQHVVSATTINRAPVANPDAVTMYEGSGSVSVSPLSNDTDPDNNTLALYSVTNGEFGTGSVSGSNVTYTSTYGRNATEKLTYTITDGQGMDSSGEITVTLANLNPVAVNDTVTTPINTGKTFDPRTNDTDPGNDPVTITAKSTPAHGTLTIGAGGVSLIYQPTFLYYGPDSFTYTITDADGGTATATVNMTVMYGTQAPVAVNDTRAALINTPVTFDPRSNDYDPDNTAITITAKTNGTKGTVAINGGTSVTYTPNAGQTGADSFTYTISDIDGQTATATVNMTIRTSNAAPVTVNDSTVLWGYYTIEWPQTENGTQPTSTFDPRYNDSDPDGDQLTITNVTQPTNGTASTNGSTVTITRNAGCPTFANVGSVTYTISDGLGGTKTGTITSSIQCENNN